jgi:hypothetical protein
MGNRKQWTDRYEEKLRYTFIYCIYSMKDTFEIVLLKTIIDCDLHLSKDQITLNSITHYLQRPNPFAGL